MKAKLLMLVVGLVVYCPSARAFADTLQPQKGLKRAYGEVSIGGGYKGALMGFGGGLMGRKRGFGVQFFTTINWWCAAGRPADFVADDGLILDDPEYPKNFAYSAAVTVAKEFNTNNKRLIWYISAGPSFTSFETKFFELADYRGGNYSASDKYNIERVYEKKMGVVFKGGVAYMSRKRSADQLSLLVNVNGKQTYAGVQLDILIGKLWNFPKPPIKPKRIPVPRRVPKI